MEPGQICHPGRRPAESPLAAAVLLNPLARVTRTTDDGAMDATRADGASLIDESERTLHAGLTHERWERMSLADQLANIGTEVARAARAKNRQDDRRLGQHFFLALELFAFTLDDERWRNQRVEIGRTREIVCDYLVGDNEYDSSAESLDAYFLPFSYLSLRAGI